MSEPYKRPEGRAQIAFISPVNGVFNGGLVVIYTVDDIDNRFQSPINGSFTRVVDSGGTVQLAGNASETLQPYLDDANLPLSPSLAAQKECLASSATRR